MVGQPMPKITWGCATYENYPCELAQSKFYPPMPRLAVGWLQAPHTNFLLPQRAAQQLWRGT